MSIWVNIARVSKETFTAIKAEPGLIEPIFFDADDAQKAKLATLGIKPEHASGFDYRSLHEGLLAMAEAMGEEVDEDDAVFNELSVKGELDFDAGMGPAFYTEPADVASILEGMVPELDDEVRAILEGANAGGEYLIGVIS